MRVRRIAAQFVSCFVSVRAQVRWHICTHLHCHSFFFSIEITRVSRVIFISHILEVGEDLSTVATLFWADGVWMGKNGWEPQKTWVFEVQTWRQKGEGFAGSVMCETRYLGIKWPQWRAFLFEVQEKVHMRWVCQQDVEGQVAVDMRVVCSRDVKKMLIEKSQDGRLVKSGSKARV